MFLCFCKKSVLIRPATLLKKRLWHRYFPLNFAKFLRTLFFIEHLRRLLLSNEKCLICFILINVISRVYIYLYIQWRNWRGALGSIAPSSKKKLSFLKKYENKSKLYVDMPCSIFRNLNPDDPLVISYSKQCHIGTNVN